jgi:hypothetical protein
VEKIMLRFIAVVAFCASSLTFASSLNAAQAYWVVVGTTPNPNNESSDPSRRLVNAKLKPCGYAAFSDWSGKWDTFTPGYDAHVIGPYGTRAKATAVRRKVLKCVPDAFVKRAAYAGD